MHDYCDTIRMLTFPAIGRYFPLAGTKLYFLVTAQQQGVKALKLKVQCLNHYTTRPHGLLFGY